jgi:hypothetical protein
MSLKRIKQILKRKAPKPRSPIFTAARQQCRSKTFRHKNDRRSLERKDWSAEWPD